MFLQGCVRVAVELDGTESEEVLGALKAADPIVLLLHAHSVSRLHASRRVFDALKRHEINTPVVHRIVFPAGADKDELVISTGSLVGGLLVSEREQGTHATSHAHLTSLHAAAYSAPAPAPGCHTPARLPHRPGCLPALPCPHPYPPRRSTAWAMASCWRPTRTSTTCAPPPLACCRCVCVHGCGAAR